MTIEHQDGKLPFDSAQGSKLTHVRGNRKKSFDQKKMQWKVEQPPSKRKKE
ncbi:MAG: hypothetical protein H7A24_16945 [Leptospiraceae bacterium]|nr:hypothetical protein [Leptospiraceae bacterium]